MKKIYSYAIDWAVVNKKQPKPIWHNEPQAGGTFTSDEDVDAIRKESVQVLRQYTNGDYAWDYAATGACEHDASGAYYEAMKEIEVAVIAPCTHPNGNMVRVRVTEDWSSWIKDVPNKLNAI